MDEFPEHEKRGEQIFFVDAPFFSGMARIIVPMDILEQADVLALRQLANSAMQTFDFVLSDLNDKLLFSSTSDEDSSDVRSTHSYVLATGAEKDASPSPDRTPPLSLTKLKVPRVPAAKIEKTRPDTPTPLSPPTPEEFDEARRKVSHERLYKTNDCTSWDKLKGCPCGDKCRFLHPNERRRPRPSQAFLDKEISSEAWRLAELRQLPRCRPTQSSR